MQKQLFSNLSSLVMAMLIIAFFCGFASIGNAQEVYFQDFVYPRPSGTDMDIWYYGWDTYRGNVDSIDPFYAPNAVIAKAAGSDGVIGYAALRLGDGISTFSGIAFEASGYTSTVSAQDASLSWMQKANDGSWSRLAVNVGSDWYVSDSTYTTPSGGWEAKSNIAISSLSQWYPLLTDGQLGFGSTPVSLPSGTLLGVGMYMEKTGAGGVCRWDDFTINSTTGSISPPPLSESGYDSASDSVYADGSVYYRNGGTGFRPWTRYLGAADSLAVCNVNDPAPDFNETSLTGRPFAIANYGLAKRTIDRALDVGDAFSATIDVDPASSHLAGLALYDSSYDDPTTTKRFALETQGDSGSLTWQLTDFYGTTDTGISVADGPIDMELTYMGGQYSDEYNIVVSTLATDDYGAPLSSYTYSGYLMGSPTNGIDRLKIANTSSATYKAPSLAYFDNLRVDYADSTVALDTGADVIYDAENPLFGLNGGTGFGQWEQQNGDLQAGYVYPSLDPGKPLPYESAFRVFGTSDYTLPFREMDYALESGDSFSVILQKALDLSGDGWAGVLMYNENLDGNFPRIWFGDSTAAETGNWTVWDNSASEIVLDTGIVADDTPVRVTFTITGEETYDLALEIWDYDAEAFGTPLLFSGVDMTGTGGGAPAAVWMMSQPKATDFFFNDMTITRESEEKLPGDANGDGKVDGSDVTILAGNWQAGVGAPDPGTITWEMGDFNGDGQIDGSDVTILAGNWQAGVEAAAASVPEPSAIVLLIVGCLALCFRRRR